MGRGGGGGGGAAAVGERVRYDPASFRRNPMAYLARADFSRIRETLPVEAGNPALERVSPSVFTVERGGRGASVSVRTVPGAAATFVAHDGGCFASGLATVTVQSDSKGVATATFFPTAGMFGPGHIEASSPEAARTVSFVVEVPIEPSSEPRDRPVADPRVPATPSPGS